LAPKKPEATVGRFFQVSATISVDLFSDLIYNKKMLTAIASTCSMLSMIAAAAAIDVVFGRRFS
jgi:hypothetical protein